MQQAADGKLAMWSVGAGQALARASRRVPTTADESTGSIALLPAPTDIKLCLHIYHVYQKKSSQDVVDPRSFVVWYLYI